MMQSSNPFALALAVAFLLATSIGAGHAQRPAPTFGVIVVFADGALFEPFRLSYRPDDRAAANPAAWNYVDAAVAGAVQSLEAAHGFRAHHVYSAAMRGFAAQLTARQIAEVETHPTVSYIESDGPVRIVAQTLPWGIDRIDADVSTTLAGDGRGSVQNVNAYILDTGIDVKNKDLAVVRHVNFASGPNTDCHGHGTHVAGTVAARDNALDVVGVAPGAPLTGIKVLGCLGNGTISDVIKGVDWVTANAVRPAIANISLGGSAHDALDAAVKRSADSGVLYSIAAGNSGADACEMSPARAGTHAGVLTTAASDKDDQESSWSSFGPCVDLWAPGVGIVSNKKGGGTATMSGTSMAAPHVGGAGALYLSTNTGASPAAVEGVLKADAVWSGTASKDGRPIQIVSAARY